MINYPRLIPQLILWIENVTKMPTKAHSYLTSDFNNGGMVEPQIRIWLIHTSM